MTEKKYEVQPLFAEPVFRQDVSEFISVEQIEYVKNLKMVRNQVNLISENLYLFNEPIMSSVKDAVQEAVNVFAYDIMGISQELYITQSWSLINNPSIGMHGHSHSNSIVSGSLYFTDLPEPNARMIFDRHQVYQQLQMTPLAEKRNFYNTPANFIEPRAGEVVLFSSSLQHYVEANNSSEDRYSIAFNTFIKGKLGEYRDVSELVIK